MKLEVTLEPTPVQESDFQIKHPTIELRPDWTPQAFCLSRAKLLAVLMHPALDQADLRREVAERYFAWTMGLHTRRQETTLDERLAWQAVDALVPGNILPAFNANYRRGFLAGTVLLYLYDMAHADDMEASKGRAIHCVVEKIRGEQRGKKRKAAKNLPTSRDQIERYWRDYRRVAHIHLALKVIHHYYADAQERYSGTNHPWAVLDARERLADCLGLAEHLRRWGESWGLPNNDCRQAGPIFAPGEVWRAEGSGEPTDPHKIISNSFILRTKELLTTYKYSK